MPQPPTSLTLTLQTLAGITTGFLVSPLLTLTDKSMVLYANGKSALWLSARKQLLKLIKTPIMYLSTFQFRWTFFVYAMTYTSSNLADDVNLSDKVGHPIQKLLMVFGVNTVCGLAKDKAFIQHFGLTKPKRFPLMALGCLLTRDIVVMSSVFTLPSILGAYLSNRFQILHSNAMVMSQLFCPLFIQLFSTPFHLIGMDIYNREKLAFFNRLALIRSLYWQTIMIVILRFLPAYGIGGVFNMKFRYYLRNTDSTQNTSQPKLN